MGGSIVPAIPFAASITTRSGFTASMSTNESTFSTYAAQMSSLPTEPRAVETLCCSNTKSSARSRTSKRPDSPPTGSAPARTIFIPVYSFGLCEAVTQTPPSSPSSPTAK